MPEALDQEIRHLQSLQDSERDPDGLAFASLADAFLQKGQTRDALALLTSGTARHPDYATGHVVATRLYHGKGMFAEAEISARRALKLDPRNIVALAALAEMLQEQGKEDEAAQLRWTLTDTDPASAEARAVADLPAVEPTMVPEAASAAPEPLAEPPVSDGLIDLTSISLPEEPSSGPVSALAPFADEAAPDLSGDLDLESLLTDPEAEFSEIEAMSDGFDAGTDDADMLLSLEPQFADVDSVAHESTEVSLDAAPDELVDVSDLIPEGEPEFADLDALGSATDEVLGAPALAPDEPADVMDLGALAPDEPADVMDLGALAPDEPADVMDLGALAPDEPVDVMDLGTLAPDEPVGVMDLGALAPDEPVGVMDLGALAPDEPMDVMDLGALAPDEPADVMDLGALAPDEPADVMDLGALAPDEPADVMDLGALAPDAPADVMDLGALAPDEPVEVMDLGALAPEEPVDVMELGALAPDLPSSEGVDEAAPAPREKKMISEEPIHTRTLAELYVKQGFTDQALTVYRSLLDSEPGAEDLLAKIAELEGVAPVADEEALSAPAAAEEEVEELARDLADAGSTAVSDDVDTPFAWTPEEESSDTERGDIGRYFDSLLDWKRED